MMTTTTNDLLCAVIGAVAGCAGGAVVVIVLHCAPESPPSGRAVKLRIKAGTPREQTPKE